MSERPAIPKPIPKPDELNAEFYEHCAKEKLCFQRCHECRTWRHIQRSMCAKCGSTDWEWEASSGRGRIFTWTVTHQAIHPAFADDVPFAVVVVELEEGVRIVSGLRELAPAEITLDLPVEVEFERVSEQIALPYFRPR